MPPLETEITVETEDVVIEYNVVRQLKDLCTMIKRLMSERFENIEELRAITEMCKSDGAENGVAEENAKQEFPENGGKEEKK